MAKLTPVEPREYTIDDPIAVQLGPPAHLFTLCEQTFTITIKEYMWPGHQPYSEEQIKRWVLQGSNPRTPYLVEIIETEEE